MTERERAFWSGFLLAGSLCLIPLVVALVTLWLVLAR